MAGRLEATGNAPSFDSWDWHQARRDISVMNARLPRLQRLVDNVRLMLQATFNLDQNQGKVDLHNNAGPLTGDNLGLARRLTWISVYFYGAADHYAQWISAQNVNTAARQNTQVWTGYLGSLLNLFNLLAGLPDAWWTGNQIELGSTVLQPLPAEAPLELAVQICLNIRDAAVRLSTPELVQEHLRTFATSNNFPGAGEQQGGFDETDHDGFSNCIFVTQTNIPGRVLVAGSTVQFLGYIRSQDLTDAFKNLRNLRFTQGGRGYDTELKLRFRNDPETEFNGPLNRYLIDGWERIKKGPDLGVYPARVGARLTAEYRGIQGEPTSGPASQGRPYGSLLDENERRRWGPFTYANQSARSNFAAKAFKGQEHWFQPTPRCMKCRVIHGYNNVEEDLEVRAVANDSCKCAEDVIYGKLRQLGLVGNVMLPVA